MFFTLNNFKKILNNPLYLLKYFKIRKLYKFPRFTETTSDLLGFKIKIADSLSFVSMYKEIFEKEIYRFNSKTENPMIIDCGANIGMSVIYFKKLYPRAEIIAFEPDPKIFNILKSNIESLNYSNIKLINSALWSSEKMIDFYADRADGGRAEEKIAEVAPIKVATIKLSNYLNRKIDLLKIDIEGAEFEVLNECKNLLNNVDNIFIEYHSFVNNQQNLHKILEILAVNNFRVNILNAGYTSEQPFIKININLGMDMQLNIFGYKK
jgi:FkbM family methyltransferase